jgi:hypothetical protein
VTDPEDGEPFTIGGHSAPLHDPTAILYVRKADLDPGTGKLKAGVPVEPLVLRANAGDCISITLENRLPSVMPDLPQTATVMGMVKRDRNDGEGSTTFSNNLMRPSSTWACTRNCWPTTSPNPTAPTSAPTRSRPCRHGWATADLPDPYLSVLRRAPGA